MGTVRQLVRAGVNLTTLHHLFVTHSHADHVVGFPHLLFLTANRYKTKVHLYGPHETLEVVKTISSIVHTLDNTLITFHSLKNGETVSLLPNLTITGVQTTNQPITFAYAVQTPVIKISFSSDMIPNPAFTRLAQSSHILIHECGGTEIELSKPKHHSSAKDAGETARLIQAKHLILTHVGMKKDIGTGKKLINEAKNYFNGKITLAYDLMVVRF